ncbi:DUF1127 domain-containing protein [Roseibium sp. Sym1]|uniref:DUF1127 domain-containing protein n=1 Tax=Roseibium sp. Sym1 TaxID=3016006 RepID=UPI0022B50DDE|nr:DUF1127 domain-containing protein [Roseibium sp. Sym1]
MTDQILISKIAAEKPASQLNPSRALRRAWQIFARMLRRRRDRAHLAELPDYLLEDIGLTRADVPGTPAVGEGWR